MAKLIALTVGETWDYVLQEQREDEPEDHVVFKLAPLSLSARAAIMDSISVGSEGLEGIKVGSRFFRACKDGIKGWRGPIVDGNGKSVKFGNLAVLRDSWIMELGAEIINRSEIGNTEEDEELVGK